MVLFLLLANMRDMRTETGVRGHPAREIRVSEEQAGQRIDNFLHASLKGVPRSHVYRILRRGEVRVNRGRIRQHYRLQLGDVVRIPPLHLAPVVVPRPPSARRLEQLDDAILFEDPGLLVLDKPAGLATHGGGGTSPGVIETLRASRSGARFLELVHRLDRDTSGTLLIAKKRVVLVALHRALRCGEIDKGYRLLVKGRWARPRTVDDALRKNVKRSGERMVTVCPRGKPSATEFEPRSVGVLASLLDARPLTGRTHQIRVHAAAAGHPVGGDSKYGDRAFNQRLCDLGLRRMFLHAHTVSFTNPTDGAEVQVKAKLPGHLCEVLERLGLDGA